MLFLPLLDRGWRPLGLPRTRSHLIAWLVLLILAAVPLSWELEYQALLLANLLLVALPEEWFFRAYFMERMGMGLRANLITSALFSLTHGLARDWTTALLVFTPSLFYGWLYQRTRDLPLLVLVHALSNLIFALFLARYVAAFLGN